MNDEDLEIVCMRAMKEMTHQQLAWIVKYGTDELHGRLRYLQKKIDEGAEVTA